MKRKIATLVVAALLQLSVAYASIKTNDTTRMFESVTTNENVTIEDVKNVARNYVPESCQNAFFHFTECDTEEETMDLMIQILAIGQWESAWRVTKSPENNNGTYDIGYLALNSSNIASKDFMARYGSDEYDFGDDENELYLAVCINFYRYLYNKYGEDATYCYNCGERRYLKNTIPATTIRYKVRISEYIDKFIYESEKEAANRLYKMQFIKDLEKRIASVVSNPVFKIIRPIREAAEIAYDLDKILKVCCVIFGSWDIIPDEKKTQKVLASSISKAKLPNPEFICIGFIRKYGNRPAPVFQSVKTGEKIIC